MKQVFLCRLLVGVLIIVVFSEGIQGILGGSEKCPDLSLQSLRAISSNYRRLHILNDNSADPHDSLFKYRVISVKFLVGSGDESLSKGTLRRWFTKRDNNNRLQLALLEHLPEDAKVIVELNYKGKKCFLSSVNSPINDETKQYMYKRKLLSLKSNSRHHENQPGSIHMLSAWMAVAVVISLVVVLAMCACGKNDVEKTLSDEVGGTDFDQQVIGVSSIDRRQQEGEVNKRTDTGSSKNSEAISTRENGGTRTASYSSQQNDLTVERTSRLDSSGSHSSTKITQASAPSENAKKVEEISLTTANFQSERVRSQSTKEQSSQYIEPGDTRGFSQSDTFVYRGNEANIATPTHGRKQPVHLLSRKESDKGKDRDGSQKSKKSWLRRKSSKNKSTGENPLSKDDKKTTSRHSDLPLPPTPESKNAPGLIEENEYETVERKTTNKTAEMNTATNLSRPSSELYACIDEEDKLKRNSSEVHMYDVVEVRRKPPPKVASDTSGLEYAYSVVAPKDKPIQPSQTSSGSGLYEVVSDDMKKNMHVPLVQDDYDYAVVQKDTSTKKSSIPIANPTRPLSDTDLAPAPPPVLGMPSAKRRAQSEGDNLHVLLDKPVTLTEPGTTVEVEHTYAKVNKQRKSVHKEKPKETVLADNFCMEGLGDESEEPPPIPPSLYAELPMKDEGGDDKLTSDADNVATMTTVRADSMTRIIDTNSIEQVNSSNNVVVSQTTTEASNIQRNSLSDVKVTYKEDKDSKLLKGSTLDSEKPVTISIDANPSLPANPLYDEIHYV